VALSLTRGLVGVLRAVVEISVLAMFHPGEELSLRHCQLKAN
jgi:hypothetical protein